MLSSSVMQTMKHIFISYLDDEGNKVDGYVDLISMDSNWVSFKTNKNIIYIPNFRVLKIKEEISYKEKLSEE